MCCTYMTQTIGKLQSRHPFLRSDLICAVDFNPLTNHANLDAKFLCLHEHFTAKYEESVVVCAMVPYLYGMVYE